MEYKELKKIYVDIVELINKKKTFSDNWKAIIIILPCLIIDIYSINKSETYLINNTRIILDRLEKGFQRNYYKEFLKEIVKVILNKFKSFNYYSPKINLNKKIQSLAFDDAIIYFKNKKWPNKKQITPHITSVIQFFESSINPIALDENEIFKKLSSEILVIILKNLEDKNKKKWDEKVQNFFKNKIYNALRIAILREKTCKLLLPPGIKEVHLSTLYSPFNRIVALIMQEQKVKVINYDHGGGNGNTNNWIFADIEFQICNEFIVLGKGFLPILEEFNKKRKPLINRDFKLTALQNKNNNLYKSVPKSKCISKNIIYLASLSPSPYNHNLPDTLNLDSSIISKINILRSLSKLKNYNILIKEHPETKKDNLIQEDILKSQNTSRFKGDIKDLNKPENLFIIDFIQTSCLAYTMLNELKTILIIHEKSDVSPLLIKSLRKYNFLKIIKIQSSEDYIDHKTIEKNIRILDKRKKFTKGDLYV